MKVILRIRWDLPWLDAEGRDRFPHRRTIEWQRERWRLFTRYTLPSLERQTYRDWDAWLLADPANIALHEEIDEEAIGGFIREPKLWAAMLANEVDRVFLMRIDSDDVLAPDTIRMMVETAQQPDPRGLDRPFVQVDHGVAWHEPTSTLYRWVNPSPPFYGRIVTSEELAGGLPGLGHHGEARRKARVIESDDPSFCVLLHGGNISNSKDGSWVRGVIEGERRAEIRGRFGL